jgi:hypothetical protein
MTRYELERDESPDGEEFGGWKVTRFHRHGWQVVFRGDFAESHDFLKSLAAQVQSGMAVDNAFRSRLSD